MNKETTKTIKSFSLSAETIDILKQLESFHNYNISKFADNVLREKGLDSLCMLRAAQDIELSRVIKNLQDNPEVQ